jgi:hypothetical protein
VGIGFTRKELGKLHKQFYEERMAKNNDKEAFQRALMSMVKAMIDIVDANNQKVEEDIKALLKKKDDKNEEKKDDKKDDKKDKKDDKKDGKN